MGYSVTIRCRSDIAKKKMLQFLEENLKDTEELFGIKCYSKISGDLKYDKNKTALGFDFQPCPEIVLFYLFMVIRWTALKIGKKDRFIDRGMLPFYLLDGYDKLPVIVNLNNDRKRNQNDLGFQSFRIGYNEKQIEILEKRYKLTVKKIDRIILGELRKLERRWNKLLVLEKKKPKKRGRKPGSKNKKSTNTKIIN